ncbi:MAG: 1-(5-phosphoribosyl)-5-[(5-phosphoribosylamino)methylideneamino]imidazole-4-carboxamide isomerase [Sedimentisphaerales bacterium]|nr:1-(5-phosphoribosyl)-5-[(5-phosphoribosylamino)methylideneamino]imidazole-4-carboxamide isomerase [Sedimentisphaerales bacterium]
MDVIPAIDLRNGQCVRLIQGAYDRQIIYKDDPVEQAREFAQVGAQRLHIVDLDGAKEGRPRNIDTVQAVIDAVDMKVDLGGGIRTEGDIRKVLDLGVDYAILGTSAVRRFDWFCTMAEAFPGQLILGLDARGLTVSTEGWTEQETQSLLELVDRAATLPIAAIIYTDITRDGMMEGPNFERTQNLVERVSLPVICAGGVTAVEDIKRLKDLGVAGAIVGRALYEGKIELKAALNAAQ